MKNHKLNVLKVTSDVGTRNWFVIKYKSTDVNPLLLTVKEYVPKVTTAKHTAGSKKAFYFLGSCNSIGL